MGCYYSDSELENWEDVCNPMGPACYECNDCECIHWTGDHSEFCPRNNPDCYADAGGYDRYYNLR